ncbi:MAG: hypothetical protein K2I29_05210 [Clostridia bacterium]|nr:hypothetical protein [Clostridia bacterium]
MLNFIKKQGIAAYVAVGSALVTFIAMILAVVSSGVRGYSVQGIAWVIVCSILTVALVAVSIFLANKFGDKFFTHFGLFVSMILCCVCGFIVIQSRAELVGTLWITALDSVNPLAVSAMNSGAGSFFMYFIAMIGFVVSGCFGLTVNEKTNN